MTLQFRHALIITIAALLFTIAPSWNGTSAGDETRSDARKAAGFSGNPNKPRRHFRVRDAAELSAAETHGIYGGLRDRMASSYALSGNSIAKTYQNWRRYNSAPYGSATHGQRFVNNYANGKAARYGKFESAGAFPAGAIIAKDSFMVAADGAVAPGPLFIMEKMSEDFSYVSGDWRYTMIMPDGSLFGVTNGENRARVEFCIGCHLAREEFDHLFFVPKKHRAN